MFQFRRGSLMLVVLLCGPLPMAQGQLGGSRAGVEENATLGTLGTLPPLDRQIAEGYIAIDGRVELRIPPTEIRVVMAVTSEGPTAQECQKAIVTTVDALKAEWVKMDVPADNIVEDFIALLPRYEWTVEKRDEIEVGVEKKSGYRMQTNLHLAVSSEAQAQAALARAFEQGVTDIIAFDYWSKELDDVKVKARAQASQVAREKADSLLGAIFETKPRAINVQEQTTVHYPDSLYHSFTNTSSEQVMPPWRRDIPFIGAARPNNTYYRGLFSNADVQAAKLPLKPEISVVSTVRLYFESPGKKWRVESGELRARRADRGEGRRDGKKKKAKPNRDEGQAQP